MLCSLKHEKFKDLCHAYHCKCTTQRFAVYEYICGNTAHPTVDHVWQAVKRKHPSITRESVFRILTEFSEWGLISRMDKIENARFDGISGNHGHLICRKCGKIQDFNLPPEIQLPDSADFEVDHIELRISGFCPGCQKKMKK